VVNLNMVFLLCVLCGVSAALRRSDLTQRRRGIAEDAEKSHSANPKLYDERSIVL
jgi:hypothetical protein